MVLAADSQFKEAAIYEHIQYVSGLLTPMTQCHHAGLQSSSLSSGSEAPRRTTGSLQDSTRAAKQEERHICHVSFSISMVPAHLSSVQCNKTSLTQSLSAKCCSNTTANDEFPEGHRDSSQGNQENGDWKGKMWVFKCLLTP